MTLITLTGIPGRRHEAILAAFRAAMLEDSSAAPFLREVDLFRPGMMPFGVGEPGDGALVLLSNTHPWFTRSWVQVFFAPRFAKHLHGPEAAAIRAFLERVRGEAAEAELG